MNKRRLLGAVLVCITAMGSGCYKHNYDEPQHLSASQSSTLRGHWGQGVTYVSTIDGTPVRPMLIPFSKLDVKVEPGVHILEVATEYGSGTYWRTFRFRCDAGETYQFAGVSPSDPAFDVTELTTGRKMRLHPTHRVEE